MSVTRDHMQRRVSVPVFDAGEREFRAEGVDEATDVVELAVATAEQELGLVVIRRRWRWRWRWRGHRDDRVQSM